jgi:hypothetical protein
LIGATTFVELEARASGGRHSLLVRGQTKFTPSKVIVSTTARFKRRRVSTPVEFTVVALAFHVTSLLMPSPSLSTTKTFLAARISAQGALLEAGQLGLEDVFVDLVLNRALSYLERGRKYGMKFILDGKSNFKVEDLEVLMSLKRLLTIPLDVQVMFDESYNHHFAFTG